MSKLSDSQIDAILNAARPLPSADHATFLEEVTEALAGLEIGDGVIHRVCRDVQRRFLKPPNPNRIARGHYW